MAKKKKKKNREQGEVRVRHTKKTLTRDLAEIFYKSPQTAFNYKQLSAQLGIKDQSTRQLLIAILQDLAFTGRLEEMDYGKYRQKETSHYVTGRIEFTGRGKAYLISDEIEEDVFISQAHLNTALDGDEVKVYLSAQRRSRSPEGEVVEVLKRAHKTIVGTVEVTKNFAFLVADKNAIRYDIFIPPAKLNGAKHGQKAVAQIVEWPEKGKNPVGQIVDVLGEQGSNDAEMHAILADFDLPYKFPEKLDVLAERIHPDITPAEIAKRRDFRNITTFTIDPEDAKDFDDALSLQKLDNGNWEIGVHIADVTHYVTSRSQIDEEALERGTSVYLVDRVVPMLPERLSNFICSLRPNEEKLTFSAVFEMDEKANVLKSWFGRTVICSDKRFTYEEAQEIIEGADGELKDEVLTMHNLAVQMRARRFSSGAISFDRAEVKFRIDEKGRPTSVFFKISKESNQLIEEFMLLANRKVAEFVGKTEKTPKTFVYRVHDVPDPEKLDTLSKFVRRYGYNVKFNNENEVASRINGLLGQTRGKAEQDVVAQMAVRAMAKAEYTTHNIGHYGLAFEHYSHFTSPIRRYPDMMVHRLLDKYLQGGASVQQKNYEKKCKHASDMERRAALAERASIKYKQVEFMEDKLGQVFDGVISGITEWGIYVELVENKIEGMVSIKDLVDDFYTFDERNYCLNGRRSKKKYQMGDSLQIQVAKTNLQKKQLDFTIYNPDEVSGGGRRKW